MTESRPSISWPALLIVALGVLVAAWAVFRVDPWGEGRTVEPIPPIDETLIGYAEAEQWATGLQRPTALAVDPQGRVFVGGDQAIVVLGFDGKPVAATIELGATPHCLAWADQRHSEPDRLYVGLRDWVEVRSSEGKLLTAWATPAPKCYLTSIAVGEEDLFAADSGNRVVWRFDPLSGKVRGEIGRRDPNRKVLGFVITNLDHFDIAAGIDGLLYVVNPRLLRIEAFTRDGEFRSSWGGGSTDLAGFCGCCNPTDLVALPDGRFVTAEKGLTRVKIYGGQGRLETVVAGPQHLADTPADLAVLPDGRVLVLDGPTRSVRVFVAGKGRNTLN